MRTMKRNQGLWAMGAALVGVFALTGVAAASNQVTTDQSGSIIVFPKVIWDGTRDTIIEISNTGNPMLHAHCFYINAAPVNPNLPPSATNQPQWNETDFDIWLTRQQPTHWVASLGRRTNPLDGFGSGGSGLDPGLVPPVPLGFRGELKCIQVAPDGTPMPGNKLKGEATLRRTDSDVSEYNAISFIGNSNLSGIDIGNDLVLDLTDAHQDGEFSACPDTLIFNFLTYGSDDDVVSQIGDCESDEGGCPIRTELTLVPCQEDLENQQPGHVTVQFQIFNEFEQPFSTSTTVDCWLNAQLNTIGSPGPNNPFTRNVLGSNGATARINPNPGNGGVIGIAEETRFTDNEELTDSARHSANAAFNLHIEGNRFDAATDGKGNPVAGVTDHIIVPGE